MTVSLPSPQIFQYNNYRLFLQDYYTFMKQQNRHFSYRYFAKLAGFTSPNFLKLVMEGDRNLSVESVERFIKAIKLNAQEARYFKMLVLVDQAETAEEMDFYTRKILKTKTLKKLKPLSQDQYDYYSQWYHIPLRELVAHDEFREDPSWIAQMFVSSLSEKQIKEGLVLLQNLGLIKRGQNGRLRQTEKILTTSDEVTSQAIKNFHRTMMQKAADAMEIFSRENREISSLTLGISNETLKKIKKKIQNFRKEILMLSEKNQPIETIVQINFQLFPLTRKNSADNMDTL